MDLNDIYLKYKDKDFGIGLKGITEITPKNYWFCLFLYNEKDLSKKEIINKFNKNKNLIFIGKDTAYDEFNDLIGYNNKLYMSRDSQKIFIVEESLIKNISFNTLSMVDFKARIKKDSITIINDRFSTLNNIKLNMKEDALFTSINESKINFIFSEIEKEAYHVNLFISCLVQKIKSNKKCCFISDENSSYVYSFYNRVIASACNINYDRLIRKKITKQEKKSIEDFKKEYGENILALKIKSYEANKNKYNYDYIFSLGIETLSLNNNSIYYILKEETKTHAREKANLLNKYSKEIKKANFMKGISEEEKMSFLSFITLNQSPFSNSFLLNDKLFFINQEKEIINNIYGIKSDKTSVY